MLFLQVYLMYFSQIELHLIPLSIVIIGLGNGLMLSGNKPLPEQKLAKIVIWRN